MSNLAVNETPVVYNRKISRNNLKKKYRTNRIANIWHKIQGKSYYTHIDKNKI